MNPETTPQTIDTPYGKLHIAVIPATEDSFHSMGRGNVTEIRPRLRIASDPTFEADPNHADHWTIRRRAYAVHETLYFHDMTHVEYANGYKGQRWHSESNPYRGGYRNDRRGQVEYHTKTWDMMRDAVRAALDEFAKANPAWGEFSTYLLLKDRHDRESGKAADLRKEAAEHEAKADKLSAQTAPMLAGLPESLRSLIRD